MPPDYLTGRSGRIAALVEIALAGTPAERIAADAGIDQADLDLAVQTYRAGGHAALQRIQTGAWFNAMVEPADWATAENTFAVRIAPQLAQLDSGQAAWWFVRKHPCWRIRIRTADHDPARAALDDLAGAGVIARWTPGFYEPEVAAFGGPDAMDVVHELFCADSGGVLGYVTLAAPKLGRRELSLLLIHAMVHHAGLDWFETADVFDRIAQMRPAPPEADAARTAGLAAQAKSLLALPSGAEAALLTSSGMPDDLTTCWLDSFATVGQQLRDAAAGARLDRGLRAILAHIVIFHWNRLGLSARAQAILARAAAIAILPRS
jgi:thiopeptide-type bacteriocin biosynthesis protein